jgi:pyruvate ferredoxin oxidoreductase alpha subunit
MTTAAAESKRTFISGNDAVSLGVKLCRPEVIAAYPITPSTTVVEKLSEYIAHGEMDCQYINVESEHSAMSAVMGASMMGCRTFTATSSQGLFYMCEMLHYVSGSRFPIVMMNGNRTVAAPWNIFSDQRDSLAMRDSGWMQVYVENAQEALDMVIQSYKIAENPVVSTPIMICLDGFILTHTYELVAVPEQKLVDSYLPAFVPTENILDLAKPKSLCISVAPEWQTEFRFQQHEAMLAAKKVIAETDASFKQAFGREYGGLVEAYCCEDADVVLVCMGSVAGTTKVVVDKMREAGYRVGLLKVRFYRPFPQEEVAKLLGNAKAVGVIDRDLSFGYQGALYADVKAALYQTEKHLPATINFIAGLSGRDISTPHLETMFEKLICISEKKREEEMQFVDLRWEQW